MKPSKTSPTTPLERVGSVALRVASDDRLAKLAATGDRVAFAAIFDRYHQDLFGYCASILHNREDAADAVQATMLRALRALDGERRDIALRPWLYRIAHNESVDLLRRPRTDPAPSWEGVSVSDVEGSAATREHLRAVLADIRQLPERQRGALVMRELVGLDYAEIAGALETSPAGAKQAVYDARRALHELARGRDFDCETIRRRLSEGDRRVFRGRTVRAHLRACGECRTFQAAMVARESSLAAFTPAMPVAAAANALHGAFTGGGAAAAGIGASAGAPALAALAVAVTIGAGAVGAGVHHGARGDDAGPPTGPAAEATPQPPSGIAVRGRTRERADRVAARRTRERAPSASARERERRRGGAGEGHGPSAGREEGDNPDAGSGGDQSGASPVSGPSAGSQGGGNAGIRSIIRGGRGDPPAGGRGPIRSQVGDTRGAIEAAADQVQGVLPVQTPQLATPTVRPPRSSGGG